MEERYYSDLLGALATRANLGSVSWLGFANVPLRRHLMDVFSRPYGETGSFLADPTFEAVFGWRPSATRMSDLSGKLLTSALVQALDSPPPDLVAEYRFAKDRPPYAHQLEAWQILAQEQANSLVVTSGTGSGKTECFMIPILDRLVREQQRTGGQLVGVRALFLYPLNALINSQRDRFMAWTHQFGSDIRYCLYNGATPEVERTATLVGHGSEVKDRKTLRMSPAPILITNATMLEYMLLRTQDASILNASQGKLEWIVLDEAHSYIGSQAAELALLIRRVIHAFGVRPENVRFVATSATIGDPQGEAGLRLREFLAQVAGVDLSRVFLVAGFRQIPTLAGNVASVTPPREDMWSLDQGGTVTPERYRALAAHPHARALRDLFVNKKGAPVARLSEASSLFARLTGTSSKVAQEHALSWLDLLSSAVDKDGTAFLPLRAHLFHQTLPGLWSCADPACPERLGTELDKPEWPYGKVFLSPRNHCTCGAPSYELAACEDCGAIYLMAESRGREIGQPGSASSVDEFSLELERAEDDAEDGGEGVARSPHANAMLITNRKLADTGVMHIDRQTRQIVESNAPGALAITVFEDGGDGLDCPACGANNQTNERLFRKGRIGAPFLLGGLLPTMLEFAPDGENAADRPYRGRRLLTFSDSRQGTARLAAKLQQDAERTKTRGYLYHHALAKSMAAESPADPLLLKEIQDLENILATPGFPEAQKPLIVNLLASKKTALAPSPQGSATSFADLQTAIAHEGLEFQMILHSYKIFSRTVFGGNDGPTNLAGMLLVREMGRRPKHQNNLETMGMVSVQYPKIDRITTAPTDWISRGYLLLDWKDFLKILLDYFVRGGGSLDIPDTWRAWLGLRFPRNWLVSPDQEEVSKGQRRWPSARRGKLQSMPVRLLANLIKADVATSVGQDSVDLLLRAAWEDVRRILALTASGYHLPLSELSFLPIREASVCPFTRRFLDTTLRNMSPYMPKALLGQTPLSEKVEVPVYDAAFGGTNDAGERIQRARNWLSTNPQVAKLREEGLWSTYNDRAIEFAPYFSTAEHSAQQSSDLLARYEKQFKDGRINILSCSTTMEMGIDIGGVQMVAMNNVPPHPANYLQRAGRAGRRRETRSVVVTLCKSNPHDQNVAQDTRWAFEAKLPAPVVSLNSGVIVQRHVNSMVLAQFLKELLTSGPQDLNKLTCGWFYEESANGPAIRFAAWCEAYFASAHRLVDAGLKQLVRHSVFEGRETESLVRQSGSELLLAAERWLAEWKALLEQEAALGQGGNSDPAVKAIAFQKKRLSKEYLLKELAVQGFLPAYGFPTSIASFDNTTISMAKGFPPAGADTDASNSTSRDDNRYIKRELASRDLVTALREYAPGAEIVMDGLVYRSAGITLNWHIPASQQDANETQAIKFAWRCYICGASGTTHSLQAARQCNACGETVQPAQIQQFLEPAGFSVDFYEDPHNNVTTQKFVPVERPWISARGAWSSLPNPNLGRFRATSDGRVYHHSAGSQGKGYALCLACGRAEPMLADGMLPKMFERGAEHKKLRSRKEERICSGSSNRWAIKEGIVLGQESRTDVLELQLRDSNGELVADRTIALTLAVALRDSLAATIGVQTSELGCDVQETLADDQRCQSIFIFDRHAAGYASSAERLIGLLFRDAAKRLDCPKACDSSCPHCVLDFDQRFDAVNLDRHAALSILTPAWLDLMRLPSELCYFGNASQIEIEGIVTAVLRESGKPNAGLTRLYIGGDPEEADIASSQLRLLSYRLVALSRPVQIVISQKTFDGLTEADRFCLASIADHPQVTVAVAIKLPNAGTVAIIADVVRDQSQVAWATADLGATVPNAKWGTSSAALVNGRCPVSVAAYRVLLAGEIRPKSGDTGDREIVVHREFDGSLKEFGKKFWTTILSQHAGTAQVLDNKAEKLATIEYSDRYLFTPLAVALLIEVVACLRQALGQARCEGVLVSIVTTGVRGSGDNRAYGTVYADWTSTKDRDAVARLAFGRVGIQCTVSVPDRMVQHGRALVLSFASGNVLTIRLDQGISYWRTGKQGSASRKFSTSFDFMQASPEEQARAVASLDLPIQGSQMPTEIFVKLRNATS